MKRLQYRDKTNPMESLMITIPPKKTTRTPAIRLFCVLATLWLAIVMTISLANLKTVLQYLRTAPTSGDDNDKTMAATTSTTTTSTTTATSGSLFRMQRIRTYDKKKQLNAVVDTATNTVMQSTTTNDENENDENDLFVNALVQAMVSLMTKEKNTTTTSSSPSASSSWHDFLPNCRYWGTVTTIFPVTAATRQIATLTTTRTRRRTTRTSSSRQSATDDPDPAEWCLVVVGDQKGPTSYDMNTNLMNHTNSNNNNNNNNARVVFLSSLVQEQVILQYKQQQQQSSIIKSKSKQDHNAAIELLSALPWNHFARKSIAYLFAISQGAELIWDFDDDNVLMVDLPLVVDQLGLRVVHDHDHNQNNNDDASMSTTTTTNSATTTTTGATRRRRRNRRPTMARLLLERQPSNSKNTSLSCPVVNPYPIFQPKVTPHIWPRGYPMEDLHKCSRPLMKETKYCIVQDNDDDNNNDDDDNALSSFHKKIGIWQSLANQDPDVDAMYRLTQPLPVSFTGLPSVVVSSDLENTKNNLASSSSVKAVVVGRTEQNDHDDTRQEPGQEQQQRRRGVGPFAPLNAQAALVTPLAYWSLWLPTTVHGRVSDIWRSYIAQTIGQKILDMQVAFVGPWVVQTRNPHSYLADWQAEHALYAQTGQLVKYLQSWEPRSRQQEQQHDSSSVGGGVTVPEAMYELYVDLYEHGILEREDVERIELWLNALHAVGYKFPEPLSAPLSMTKPQSTSTTGCTPGLSQTVHPLDDDGGGSDMIRNGGETTTAAPRLQQQSSGQEQEQQQQVQAYHNQ